MSRLWEALCDLPVAYDEMRAEAAEDRRRSARMNHWCTECNGNVGKGSPCYVEPQEPEPQDEEDFDA